MPGWPWTDLCWSLSLEVPVALRFSVYLAYSPLWGRRLGCVWLNAGPGSIPSLRDLGAGQAPPPSLFPAQGAHCACPLNE